ncbi:putative autophagic serine protease alp2 protein [Lasiodiplodia theobromae]|uniref:Subtilisin-like protease n=1 Tax=Lasiodiplodia theobromae TaxID=45133 RepID=A0A5N5D0V9_9PEZI|nr:Autophagic serine protease alp2 [Lasiodiplodia theobromae]KAB2571270.1 Subtilisin-like protease [Lasiodiplodia theobromae]KAF4542749.1 Autophagic serine protease alp2 [Lasiodiplodia theobromae]KAF9640870.1 putative autophagic serine protease alp2 protein [Lasiodiplodia theobromae]
MKAAIGLSLLPVLATASPVLNTGSIHNDAAPVISSVNSKEVPNSYIIKFKSHVKHDDATAHHTWVQEIHSSSETERTELRKRSQFPIVDEVFEGLKHTYNVAGGFLGYSGHFDEDVIEQIRRHPDVEYVEKDSEVHTMKDDDYEVEKNAPWGLARISHRESLSFGTFSKYLYTADGGEGVDVYVIDTGTNTEHVDFEGRAHWGKTIPQGDADEDGNGHGTHCSGTVAGKKYGVAKKANVYAVKVLRSNGSGTMSDVVKGVEYAAEQHASKVEAAKSGKGKKGFKGSAANMSLGGGKSTTLDLAVNAAVDAGIHFAVAAGNDNADSCRYSPAGAEKAVTVGASTLADERAYFSNYGKCNDIFAPGLNILSTWIGSKYATNKISGTSMASPHIAGLLAYFLSLQPASDSAYSVAEITPAKLKKQLIAVATEDALSDVPSDTTNLLAWNGGGKSNYSEIVADGGYKLTSKVIDISLPSMEDVEEEVESVSRKFSAGSEKLESKIEKLAEKFEDFVADEMEDFLEEFKRHRAAKHESM